MAVDRRFYKPSGPLSLDDIAARLGTSYTGRQAELIRGIAPAHSAGPGEVCFIDGGGAYGVVAPSAGLCLVREGSGEDLSHDLPVIAVSSPRVAFAQISRALFAERSFDDDDLPPAALHPKASVDETARIGRGAAIGEGTRIGPGAVIGPGVQIGRNCDIGPLTSVRYALLGDRVRLSAGVRIGETGFGVTSNGNDRVDLPHFGRAILQDDVSIGANTCVDRGMLEDTVIGEGSRIDNLCQIAHNVTIGRGVIMAAFGGISGSVKIGDGAMLGGRVGIADHISVGAGARLAADTALFRDVPAGESWGGGPAKPARLWAREMAWLARQASRKGPRRS